MASATTQACIVSLKQGLATAGFYIPNPNSSEVDTPTLLAATALTTSAVAEKLRGGSGLTEEAEQIGACTAVRAALAAYVKVPSQLAPLVAKQRAALPAAPPPPPPSAPGLSPKTIAYVGVGVLAVAAIGGLVWALRR